MSSKGPNGRRTENGRGWGGSAHFLVVGGGVARVVACVVVSVVAAVVAGNVVDNVVVGVVCGCAVVAVDCITAVMLVLVSTASVDVSGIVVVSCAAQATSTTRAKTTVPRNLIFAAPQ